MKRRTIIINVKETATIGEIDSVINYLESSIKGSKMDNVIESIDFMLDHCGVVHV